MNAPNQSESTALAVAAAPQFDLTPQSFEQALQFADYLAASELVPRNYRGKPADCFIALAWGMEVKLKPIQSINSIATINGKPGLYGDAGKAILLAAGCVIEEDDTEIVKQKQRGRCRITRPGRPAVERTFSLEDAKTAGLWGKEGPWKTYPYRQMAWRAFWFAARDAAADLLRGMSGAEELVDMPPQTKDMGQADVVHPTGTSAAAATAYPEDKFKANLPDWTKVLAAGRKTHDEMIAFIESKGNPLSDDQKKRIRELPAPKGSAVDAQPKPAATASSEAPVVTYADVAGKLEAAKTRDELNTAGDLIGSVADAEHRRELQAIFNRREGEIQE